MAQNQTMSLGITGSNLQIVAHLIPDLRRVRIFPIAVMVATDECHVFAGDTLAQAHGLRHGQAIRKVSQDIETVVRSHAPVNGIDNLTVHFLDRGKRSIHIVKDIRIAQVQVGGKPHHRLCPHFATRFTETSIQTL